MDAEPFLERSREQLSLGASVWNSVVMFFSFTILGNTTKNSTNRSPGSFIPSLGIQCCHSMKGYVPGVSFKVFRSPPLTEPASRARGRKLSILSPQGRHGCKTLV